MTMNSSWDHKAMQKIIHSFLASFFVFLVFSGISQADTVSVDEVLSHCYLKNMGEDQKFRIDYTVTNKNDKVAKRREFVYFWKNYHGEGDLLSKLMLFTVFPGYPENPSYLRWNYTKESGKPAEQWLYSPKFHSVTRVSGQKPEDMTWRSIAEDMMFGEIYGFKHTLLNEEQEMDFISYDVESVPKSPTAFYGKIVSHYRQAQEPDSCVLKTLEYYDKDGHLVKSADYTWETRGDVWVWKTIDVQNEKPELLFSYKNKNIEVNIGLEDSDFTKRIMQKSVR